MKKRILSLALVCVMLLTAIPVFALSAMASETPSSHTSAWTENTPTVTVENGGSVSFPGAWTVGYKTAPNNFTLYGNYASGGGTDAKLISATGADQWTNGGYYSANYSVVYKRAAIATSKAVFAYRYAVEHTGDAVISVDSLYMLDWAGSNNAATGVANSAIAIAVNGIIVWPANATFENKNSWYYDANSIGVDVSANIPDISVSLNEGDTVEFLFVSVAAGAWSHYEFEGAVHYPALADTTGMYKITYVGTDGKVLAAYQRNAGDAFPYYPANCGWDSNGDGEADELPATVTDNATLTYVDRINPALDLTGSSTTVYPSVVNGVISGPVKGWDTVTFSGTSEVAATATRYPFDIVINGGSFLAPSQYNSTAVGHNGNFPTAVMSNSGYWSPYGSFSLPKNYTAGWRFTSVENGVIDITVNSLVKGVAETNDTTNVFFAVYKNNEKIWPTGDAWYQFTTKSDVAAQVMASADAAALSDISVQKDDKIEFLVYGDGSAWKNVIKGNFTVQYEGYSVPEYITAESGAVSLGEQFAPSFGLGTTYPEGATNVGAYFNGDFYAADAQGMVKLPGISAKNLTDYISVVPAYTNARGQIIASEAEVYSVADLLMQYVNGADEKAADLAIATLNYAAAAQEFFGYNTFDLANAALTDEQKAVADGSCDDGHIIDKEEVENEIATFWGVKLILGDTVNMAVYFKSDVDLTAGYTAVCARYPDFDEDASVQFRKTETAIEEVSEGLYKVIFTGFMPGAWNGNFHFYLTDGEDTKVTDGLHYDVLDYLARADEAEMAEIVDAMLALYEAAKAYNA